MLEKLSQIAQEKKGSFPSQFVDIVFGIVSGPLIVLELAVAKPLAWLLKNHPPSSGQDELFGEKNKLKVIVLGYGRTGTVGVPCLLSIFLTLEDFN